MNRAVAVVLAALVVAATVACSPEASRVRGGGPGADVGNHGPSMYQPSTAPPYPGG